MDARLGLEQPLGERPGDRERRAFDACVVAGLDVHEVHFEALVLGETLVHTEKHLRPVAGFGASRPCVNSEDGVERVLLLTEHFLEFDLLEQLTESQDLGADLLQGSFVGRFFGELKERFRIR